MLLSTLKTEIEAAIHEYREVSRRKLSGTADSGSNQRQLVSIRQRIVDLNKQQVELTKQLREAKLVKSTEPQPPMKQPSKDEVLKGVGLIPKKAYEDLCAQRSVRRHRSTANPKFAQRKETVSRPSRTRNRQNVAVAPPVVISDESNDSKSTDKPTP